MSDQALPAHVSEKLYDIATRSDSQVVQDLASDLLNRGVIATDIDVTNPAVARQLLTILLLKDNDLLETYRD